MQIRRSNAASTLAGNIGQEHVIKEKKPERPSSRIQKKVAAADKLC